MIDQVVSLNAQGIPAVHHDGLINAIVGQARQQGIAADVAQINDVMHISIRGNNALKIMAYEAALKCWFQREEYAV